MSELPQLFHSLLFESKQKTPYLSLIHILSDAEGGLIHRCKNGGISLIKFDEQKQIDSVNGAVALRPQIEELIDRLLAAVSYTHLDVYKRQE